LLRLLYIIPADIAAKHSPLPRMGDFCNLLASRASRVIMQKKKYVRAFNLLCGKKECPTFSQKALNCVISLIFVCSN